MRVAHSRWAVSLNQQMIVLGDGRWTTVGYVIITIYLHKTPVTASLWNIASYIMITVDRPSAIMIDIENCNALADDWYSVKITEPLCIRNELRLWALLGHPNETTFKSAYSLYSLTITNLFQEHTLYLLNLRLTLTNMQRHHDKLRFP